MAIAEILIVLSSIAVEDTLPKISKTVPVVIQKSTTDSLQNKKQAPSLPVKVKKEKEALLRKVSRGGWDRN